MATVTRVAGVAALICLLMAVGAPAVRGESLPIDDTEAYAFLQELSWAFKACDFDRLQELMLQDATLTFTVQGNEPVTMSRDEYLRDYRKRCYHSSRSYDRSNFTVRIEPDRVVATIREEQGKEVQFFFLDSQNVDWIEQTLVIVRAGETLGVQEVQSVMALAPTPASTTESKQTNESRSHP